MQPAWEWEWEGVGVTASRGVLGRLGWAGRMLPTLVLLTFPV